MRPNTLIGCEMGKAEQVLPSKEAEAERRKGDWNWGVRDNRNGEGARANH